MRFAFRPRSSGRAAKDGSGAAPVFGADQGPAPPGTATPTLASATPAAAVPLWVRLLDLVTLALAVLAVVVLIGGGWRVTVFDILVRIRAWWRPLLWALAVGALRHWLVRRPTLLDVLRGDYLKVRGVLVAPSGWPSAFAAAFVPVVFSRVMVYTVGLFALAAIGLPVGAKHAPGGRLFDMLSRWDATWYMHIAENGYYWTGNPARESPVVFFPALPMLMRAGAWITGAHVAYVGLAVSMLAFAWAAAYLYRIARDQLRLESPEAAVSFLAWYPFSLWFGAVYTESLILLAVVGAFYHARARQRLPAAAWGFVAALSKPNGVFVALPMAVIYGLHLVRHSSGGWRVWRDGRALRAAAADALVLAAPALGLAAYCLYLWRLTGDPLAWLHGQLAWDRVFRGPGELLMTLQSRLGHGLVEAIMDEPFDVMNTSAVIFALVSVVPIFFRIGAAEALFVVISIVPPLLAGGTTSMARFSSCLFPVFLWLGAVVRPSLRVPLCALFAAGQAFSASLFLTWRHLV